MFDPSQTPRVFGVPPGVDFPAALVDGFCDRMQGMPPTDVARVQLVVNTRRMARRVRVLFDQRPAMLLPKIGLVTDLGQHWDMAHIPRAVSPLRRRLELIQLISSLLDRQPDLAPRASMYDLADSLAALMDEMHGEGVSPDAIDQLDITDQSGHWDRIRSFLSIVRHFSDGASEPSPEKRQRLVIERLVQQWEVEPPQHPIILAGSTGSRGATQVLMQAVARLPQGAIVFPGYDFDMPDPVWRAMDNALSSEDHPQYRFHAFQSAVKLNRTDVVPWSDSIPANSARNRVISLALRPAPITDQWRQDGPGLTDIPKAMQDVTLIEAPSLRIEALTIAMRLRKAAEDGQTAALISPDRMLTRQVTAALDRWNIVPDDSAGTPLHLSPPGRFLRHTAELFRNRLTAESLLTLLKHPLTHSGADRGPHLRLTRELELHLRRNGPPYPDATAVQAWVNTRNEDFAPGWGNWVCKFITGQVDPTDAALSGFVVRHVDVSEKIALGSTAQADNSKLWSQDAGREARVVMDNLRQESEHGGQFNAADYANLLHSLLSRGEVRNPTAPHPGILIWGTLEARVQGADLLILAGLNEGSWPEAAKPDPWLNRALRHQAGLLLPERRIGLAAHDFQQAVSAPEVWITRSVRSDDSETVVSRWLNRLQNLLAGLPAQGGAEALDDMRARGAGWIEKASLLEAPEAVVAQPRPAPCPPVGARPTRLSVTEIKRLIRDPYAIYAKHVLKLRPLNPLMQAPDALLRGIILHEVLEQFIAESKDDNSLCTRERLIAKTESILAENAPWASARAMWLARMERVSDWFVETEHLRREQAQPTALETKGGAEISKLGFTLVAEADRIDLDASGNLFIYDYKTGAPPSKKEQVVFDKQLLLEAAIAQRNGFGDLVAGPVARAVYIGLGSGGREMDAPLDDEPPETVWAKLAELIEAYQSPTMGYTSRRAMQRKTDAGDYDQLARFGEWDITDLAVRMKIR